MGAHESVVGWAWGLQVRFLMRSLDFLIDLSLLAALWPLTEMSTRNLSGGKRWPAHKANNLTAVWEPIVWKMMEPRCLRTLLASMACYRDRSTVFFYLTAVSWLIYRFFSSVIRNLTYHLLTQQDIIINRGENCNPIYHSLPSSLLENYCMLVTILSSSDYWQYVNFILSYRCHSNADILNLACQILKAPKPKN
jgi:hypothetical protein